MGVEEIATAVVTYLAAYLTTAGQESAKKIGEKMADSLGQLYEKTKGILISSASQEVLAELEAVPDDVDRQLATKLQVKRILQTTPALQVEFLDLLKAIDPKFDVTQTATQTGDQNVSIQVAGSGNTVNLPKT